MKLYHSTDYFKSRFGTLGRSKGFNAVDRNSWQFWRQDLRAAIGEAMGLTRMIGCPLNARITETVQCSGYSRERVEIDTEPGVTMPLYVLIPDGLSSTTSAVLALHGHFSGGKLATTGQRDTSPLIEQSIDRYNNDYGLQAVLRGHVVFCPDARGFGERRERFQAGPEQLLESSCRSLAHMGLPLGLTVAGMWVWDLMVLLNYIETRSETVGENIGCIGLSGGGMQTLYISALDDRIDCAVVSGYFYGAKDSLLHMADNCDCNYIPGGWEMADMGDIAALIAPRKLFFEAGRTDPHNGPRGIENVLEQYAIAKSAFELLGVQKNLAIDLIDAGHIWQGALSVRWLDECLKG